MKSQTDQYATKRMRQKIRKEWRESVVRLAGAWKDLEEAAELRESLGEDIPREAS